MKSGVGGNQGYACARESEGVSNTTTFRVMRGQGSHRFLGGPSGAKSEGEEQEK